MEIQGKIIAALPERSGTSARGEWKMQEFVLETHESFPHKMMFSVFGADRLQRFNIQIGMEALVAFDINAREYNGRWYNDIRAFDVRPADPNAGQPIPAQDPFGAPVTPSAPVQPAAQPVAAATVADPLTPEPEGDNPDNLPF